MFFWLHKAVTKSLLALPARAEGTSWGKVVSLAGGWVMLGHGMRGFSWPVQWPNRFPAWSLLMLLGAESTYLVFCYWRKAYRRKPTSIPSAAGQKPGRHQVHRCCWCCHVVGTGDECPCSAGGSGLQPGMEWTIGRPWWALLTLYLQENRGYHCCSIPMGREVRLSLSWSSGKRE